MPEPVVEIPNRPAFRASEVCELAQIPPYVLKSWEKEFPGLGIAPKPGAARVYRRSDVEQVLRIKQMLFNEGLTLSGVRRKLEGEPKLEEEPLPELPPARVDVREKVGRIKQELRSLLDMLSAPASGRPAVAEPSQAPRALSGAPRAASEERATPAHEPVSGDLPLLEGVAGGGAEQQKPMRRAKHTLRPPRQSA